MAKILIVEDNQGTNKAICEYMKEAGHTLFSAFTGRPASYSQALNDKK